MVEVVGLPSVAFSKRKLITNFFKDLNKPSKEKLTVIEKWNYFMIIVQIKMKEIKILYVN